MDKSEYFQNDNVIIPDYIKKMSKEELEKEIARQEKAIADRKQIEIMSVKKAL